MEIKVEVKGLDATLARLGGLGKQVDYATAVALTKTAKVVQAYLPAELDKALDRPTPFTKRGVFITPARRDTLFAVVGIKDIQAKYLRWQFDGGTRAPGAKGLKLPSAVNLNEFGNIPKGVIKQLIGVARRETGLKKRTATKIKVSQKVEIFYGDPADVGGHKFPPGIYKRVNHGGGRHQLIPLIVFPRVAARYKKRFDFPSFAAKIVDREWPAQFDAAFKTALETAR